MDDHLFQHETNQDQTLSGVEVVVGREDKDKNDVGYGFKEFIRVPEIFPKNKKVKGRGYDLKKSGYYS